MLDGLNARLDRDAVCFGRTHAHRPWLMRNEMLSRRYTTDWDELLAIWSYQTKQISALWESNSRDCGRLQDSGAGGCQLCFGASSVSYSSHCSVSRLLRISAGITLLR